MAIPFADHQDQLTAVLRLADLLLSAAEGEEGAEQTRREARRLAGHIRARGEATVRAGGSAPLEYLFGTFGLTDFEQICVCLSLAPELDSSYEGRFASLQEDRCRLPSLELCLRVWLPDRKGRGEELARWREREQILSYFFREGHRGCTLQSDLTAGLKLDQRMVSFILDLGGELSALKESAWLYWPGETPPPLSIYGQILEQMTAYGQKAQDRSLLFFLQGEEGAGRRTLLRHFCQREDRPLLVVDLPALLRRGASWEESLRLVYRETAIYRAALCIFHGEYLLEREEPGSGEKFPADRGALEERRLQTRLLLKRSMEVTDRLFLLSEKPRTPELSFEPWQWAALELPMPDTHHRLALWTDYLAGLPCEEINLEELAAKFALNPGQISAAAREARHLMDWEGAEVLTTSMLHRACQSQLSHNLGKMASRVNAAYTWEDLILPPEQKGRLKNACAQVEFRHRVYDQWGFGKKIAYGRGLSMLFTGPPGTGKTMAAQVIANRLGLELYKVDLSGVMSKYIGETEKQLGAVFDEVKKSQSILLFDEADALFGKRSETKDSHDRYANIQTSYLLQKMEEYEGIVILTSNFRQNFDEAFTRRIKYIVEFSLPERQRREELWRSVLPRELPIGEELDFDFLARSFELSGSSIKNIALSAAFLAAEEGEPLGMRHLLLALQAEEQKAGKSLNRAEFGEYYHLIQDYRQSRR